MAEIGPLDHILALQKLSAGWRDGVIPDHDEYEVLDLGRKLYRLGGLGLLAEALNGAHLGVAAMANVVALWRGLGE